MSAKFLAGVDANNQRVVQVASPSSATDAANKAYVDGLVQGLRWKDPVRAATTANITLSAPQTIDTVSIVAGDRVLVKNQTTGSANGVYTAAAGAWVRAVDADTSAEIDGMACYVLSGSVNGDKAFTLTTDAPTLGSTSLTYAQMGGAGGTTYTAGAGLTESPAATFNVAAAGGAGITVNADDIAVDPAVVVRKYAQNVGALTAGTPLTITHGLNTLDVIAALVEVSTGIVTYADIVVTGVNTLTVTSATAVSANVYRIIVHA